MLLDFATRIQTAGVGSLGDDLFVYYMPSGIKRGILLRSGLEGAVVDPEIPDYRPEGQILLIVRSKGYEDGFDLIDQATEALKADHEAVGRFWVNYLRPVHEPIVYPRSEGDGLEFSVRFVFNLVREA